jgi:hypothetical protein
MKDESWHPPEKFSVVFSKKSQRSPKTRQKTKIPYTVIPLYLYTVSLSTEDYRLQKDER